MPAGKFHLFDALGDLIGQPAPFNAGPGIQVAQSADASIAITFDSATIPYAKVLDFETSFPPPPPPIADLISPTLIADPVFWGFGLDNLAGTFGSTEIAGSSPANPLLPNLPNSNGGFNFSVTFPDPNSIIFIDPDIAIGYTYTITGDLFGAVQAPSNLTDQSFELLLGDATCTTFASQGTITGGLLVPFATGVPCFQILGIDIAEALDPTNPAAFVTGISTVNPAPIPSARFRSPSLFPVPCPWLGREPPSRSAVASEVASWRTGSW